MNKKSRKNKLIAKIKLYLYSFISKYIETPFLDYHNIIEEKHHNQTHCLSLYTISFYKKALLDNLSEQCFLFYSSASSE